MKGAYQNILKSICIQLGLLEGESTVDSTLLEKAANWALNTEGYHFKKYEATALKPILSTLNNKLRTDKKLRNQFLPAKSLTLDKDGLMPSDQKPSESELKDQLDKLKLKLQKANNNSLLLQLERHASTLAFSKDFADIPLYDFIKISVGIALCIEAGNGEICLAGGTISGIQAYLYDIVSDKAARLLKGRSFYLQLLADSLLQETIDQFELSPCHVVYSSGGGFYVLMPKSAVTKEGENFDTFARDMSSKIYKKHRFALFFEMAITESFNKDLTLKNEKDVLKPVNAWDELFIALNKKKYKRLKANVDIKEDFFKDFIEAGGTKTDDRDHVTNEEFREEDKDKVMYFDLPVRKTTEQQMELGRHLREADYWGFSKNSSDNSTISDPLGNNHYFKGKRGQNLKTLNKPFDEDFPTVFYGGNEVPHFKIEREWELKYANEKERERNSKLTTDIYDLGDIKPFEYLVGYGNLTRMAILRMDVDGLGAIFSENIGDNQGRKNICRYVATSRSLDFFFKGYLNTLREKYDDTISIIYSGGDDLFIVGKWNDVFELTETINNEFQRWSCNNLTISGGAVLLPPKFPIMQSARLAEIVEKKAKDHKFPSDTEGIKVFEKNAVCLFDMPLNWENEYLIVKDLYVTIHQMIKLGSLSMNFINKIMGFAETQKLYKKFKKYQAKVENKVTLKDNENREYQDFKNMNLLRWQWNMAYDLTRFADNSSSARDKDAKDFVKSVMTNSFANTYNDIKLATTTGYHYLELLQIACRWAELEKRTQEE